MNLANTLDQLVNLPDRLRTKYLANQIAQLHPELDSYQGKDKIKIYALLANRLATDEHDFPSGKPDFDYSALNKADQLRFKAFSFMAVELTYHFQAKWITAQSKNLSLNEVIEEQKLCIDNQISLVVGATQMAKKADKTIRDVSKAVDPNSRLN